MIETLSYSKVPDPVPRRWWVMAGFVGTIVSWPLFFQVTMTPPGWPLPEDLCVLALIPIGGIMTGWLTSIPAPALGVFGALMVFTALPGRFADGNLGYRLPSLGSLLGDIIRWVAFDLLAWGFCRSCVLLRPDSLARFRKIVQTHRWE